MSAKRVWTVEIVLTEEGGTTRADAILEGASMPPRLGSGPTEPGRPRCAPHRRGDRCGARP